MDKSPYFTTPAARVLMPRSAYIVAVTGHQRLGEEPTQLFVARAFAILLRRLHERYGARLVVLSGLADGADSLFAETALIQGIPLVAVLAAAGIHENFVIGPQRERFLKLCQRSQAIYQLGYPAPSEEAYMALGRWLVDTCDMLIAAWNGLPAAGLGGTGDVVAYALQQQTPVLHLHTHTHRLHVLT